MTNAASQLQLFETPVTGTIRRPAMPPTRLELRQDHVILLGILGLIGVSIIFAWGVERGKQLARGERLLIAPSNPASEESPLRVGTTHNIPSSSAKSSSPVKIERQAPPAGKPVNAPRTPKRLAGTNSRFAIQVVSYSQPALAAQELKRLQARGESAFLVKKQDKTVLYVGPFDSRQRAKDKVAGLRSRYRDCFVRSL